MKLVLAIVQDKDADTLAKEFIQNDVRATKLATSGGFLRAGNTTFLFKYASLKRSACFWPIFFKSIIKSV